MMDGRHHGESTGSAIIGVVAHPLFNHLGPISDWLRTRQTQAARAVERIPAARMLRDPIDELVDEVVGEYTLAVPRLTGERRSPRGVAEASVDVSGDRSRAVLDRSRPVLVPGYRVEVRERFNGHTDLLNCCPSRHDLNPPRGDIDGNEVVITIGRPADALNATQVKGEVEDAFGKVARYLEWAAADVQGFNNNLAATVRSAVQGRRQRLEAAHALEDMLGIPIDRRTDASPSLSIDVPRRRVPTIEDSRTTEPRGEDEAFLRDEGYQEIIAFLGSIRRLIERLPHTFSPLPEESLRDILLLILNNQFGAGTGESFSRNGKTDIMIQLPGGPVFIAECKIWHGAKKFREAIDQLLGYLVWRDTKAAMVLFVRERDVTTITQKALDGVRRHPRFVRDAPMVGGDPVVLLHQEGDRRRMVRVALIAVPIPPD